MTLDELFEPKIIVEAKRKVWTRKDGKLVDKTNEERPSRNAIFDDRFIKTKIRVKKNGK